MDKQDMMGSLSLVGGGWRDQWAQQQAQFDAGCAVCTQLENAIIESGSRWERWHLVRALNYLSWHVAHALDREPVTDCYRGDLVSGIQWAQDVLAWAEGARLQINAEA